MLNSNFRKKIYFLSVGIFFSNSAFVRNVN